MRGGPALVSDKEHGESNLRKEKWPAQPCVNVPSSPWPLDVPCREVTTRERTGALGRSALPGASG